MSSVNRDNNQIENPTIVDKNSAPSRAKQIVHTEDIVFGTTRPMLKRLTYIPYEYDGEVCSTGFCVLRIDKNIVLPKWIYYQLMTRKFYHYVEKTQKGVSYPAITDKEVKDYIIPVPPLDEQERIVSILDRFDKLCNDISEGLPAEIEARQKQYEYYRDKLLTFKMRNS